MNHPVSLEVLLHGGIRKTIFPVPMVNSNAWIFKLDSVQKIVQCKLNVANRNCSLDSVKIILGNSCDGYPSDLKELPKTCIDYAPQFSLILDPRPAVLECKPIHPRKDIYVSKCDTIHESLRINNLGLGYASQTVLHVKVPLGVKLLNSTVIYTLSNPSQYNVPISFNPVLMEYDVVLTSNVLSSLFPGFTESDSSSIELKLIFAIDCDLDNGTSINYRISYEEVCSKAHSLPVKYTPRIFFKESIPSNNYTLDYKIEKSNSCTKDFILNVSLVRLNSDFNKGDRITITYDKIMGFNSQASISSIGLKNNNYKYLVDNATESLTFELSDGLKKGDSVIIKIPMNSHCESNCKSTFLDLKIEELKTINCSTSPSGRCYHYSVTKSIYFDDVKLYPDIQIDSIDINYIGLDSSLIEFSSKIAITNSSKMDLYQDLKLKIFHDKNNNGQIDQGDILLERISNNFFIVKDSTYILNATHRVDPSLACPLLVVLFKEDNPCLCYSDTFIIQSHMIESLSQKFELCESEELILDFRKQLAKGITISFDPNPYLTKLAENHFIFKKQITSGTSKEFEELFYEIEIASLCQSRNKIEITIDPNCVKETIDPKIYFPSVFSPNGDGINDDLILVGTDQIDKILSIKIYNRWGVLVHSNNHLPLQDHYPLWNGEMNGKPLNPGVFRYIIQILAKDGRKLNLTGDITLVR
ncbi:MAG: gliding motility-associated C-terminal domain-containing protein [Saprospiraceae bacterium]|nr:gliding motility-associated C-terminal domain-containing protein [Saprospiraceae bacterium]